MRACVRYFDQYPKALLVPSPTGLLLDKSENSYVVSMSVALLMNHVATQEKQETDTPCTYSSENTMGTLPGHNILDLSQKEWLVMIAETSGHENKQKTLSGQ